LSQVLHCSKLSRRAVLAIQGMSGFAEQEFKRKLNCALDRVRVVLGDLRHPCLPADAVHHRYQDKYLLAECVTNTAIASQMNCILSSMGLS